MTQSPGGQTQAQRQAQSVPQAPPPCPTPRTHNPGAFMTQFPTTWAPPSFPLRA